MATSTTPSKLRETKSQLLAGSVERLLSHDQMASYPPFGLINFGIGLHDFRSAGGFDPRDPFGHLGESFAHTFLFHAINYAKETSINEKLAKSEGSQYGIGSRIMAYLMALIPKLYAQSFPEKPLIPADLADIARNSYNPLIKRMSSHNRYRFAEIARTCLKPGWGIPLFSGNDFANAYPFENNPFNYRKFRLETNGESTRVVSPPWQVVPGERLDKVCPAGRVVLASGTTAMRSVWLHMVDITEQQHFQNQAAIEWALR